MGVELVLLMGLQASGKSTFYRERLSQTHLQISKDLMTNVKNANKRQEQMLREALSQQKSVAIDNTNPNPEVRAPLLDIGRAAEALIIGYYFESKLVDCLARNQLRSGKAKVPDVALYATTKRLILPSKEEGFDQLFYVRMLPEGGFEVAAWNESGTR